MLEIRKVFSEWVFSWRLLVKNICYEENDYGFQEPKIVICQPYPKLQSVLKTIDNLEIA